MNIASILITLTEINIETHYIAKKKTKKKKQKKPNQIKNKEKTSQKCTDWNRTHSVNLQGSRSSDYAITAMAQ